MRLAKTQLTFLCGYPSEYVLSAKYMAVGQNQWYHFGGRALPLSIYFSGDWDVHWGYGILTHGHIVLGETSVYAET